MLLDSFSANIETLNAFFFFLACLCLYLWAEKRKKRKEFHLELQVNNFQKVPFVLSKHFIDFLKQQFCDVEFLFKFLNKMITKRNFSKVLNNL